MPRPLETDLVPDPALDATLALGSGTVHDLRNLLAHQRLTLSLLHEGADRHDSQREALFERLEQNLDRASLCLGRISDALDAPLQATPFDLRLLLVELQRRLEPQIDRDLVLSTESVADLPPVHCPLTEAFRALKGLTAGLCESIPRGYVLLRADAHPSRPAAVLTLHGDIVPAGEDIWAAADRAMEELIERIEKRGPTTPGRLATWTRLLQDLEAAGRPATLQLELPCATNLREST